MPARAWAVAGISLLLAACGGHTVKGDGPPASGSASIPTLPGDAVPRHEPRSKYGNGPVYEVLGQRYTVLPTSEGYQERGVASWYGKKFHGRLTSNREPYDMYAMTAAHKTLPLPTYVQVRNLQNNRTVVVRVNDRGPFLHNRIIDLSYAAALKLDMVKDGTALVQVTAIDVDAPAKPAVQAGSPPATATGDRIYVQVGAFGDRSNAERRLDLLRTAGIDFAFIHEDHAAEPPLFRVRIGPVVDVEQYDMLVDELESVGINDPYLIKD